MLNSIVMSLIALSPDSNILQAALLNAKQRLFGGLNPEIYKLIYLLYWPLAITLIGSLRPGQTRQWAQILTTSLLLVKFYNMGMFLIGTVAMSFMTYTVIRRMTGRSMAWTVAGISFAHLVLILCTRDRGFLLQPGEGYLTTSAPSSSWVFEGFKMYFKRSALAPISSLACMWLITKLQAVAWHVHDQEIKHSREKITLPGFTEILAYTLWCPTLFTPAFPYEQYLSWCYDAVQVRSSRYPWSELRTHLASKGRQMLCCLFAFLLLISILPDLDFLLRSGGWILQFKKLCHLYLFVLACRFQRYYWWFLWEMGCLFSSVGISRHDHGELDLGAIQNMNISDIELGFTARIWRSWNMRMQGWLHSNVYRRLGPNSRAAAPYKAFATFFLCGVWHGVKPMEIGWGITSGVTQLVMKRVETSTSILIKYSNLRKSKYVLYAIEWILAQGVAILLMAPWAKLSTAHYDAVWKVYGWAVPALVCWLGGLELCTMRVKTQTLVKPVGKKL